MGFLGVRKFCCLLPTHSEILLLHCELKDFFFILYYFYPNSVILILQMEALYSKLYDKYTKLKVNVTMCIFIYYYYISMMLCLVTQKILRLRQRILVLEKENDKLV